jgi:hypothetical protein
VGKAFSEVLDNTTFNCKQPFFIKDNCGVNNQKGTIYLPAAFNKKVCGSLENTISHEVSHSPPFNYREDNAFIFEYGLFGAEPASPASFRKAYDNLPNDAYRNYEDFYNNIFLW